MSVGTWMRALCVVAAMVGIAYAVGTKVIISRPSPYQVFVSKYWRPTGAGVAPPAPTVSGGIETAIDSALLPLVKTIVPGSTGGLSAGDGGGIAHVGPDVFVADAHGAFAVWRSTTGALEPLVLPPLPNNKAAFQAALAARKALWPDAFRTHDLEAIREGNKVVLLVAHETFRTDTATTALAVSRIALDGSTFLPVSDWSNVYTGPPLRTATYYALGAGGRMHVDGGVLYLTAGDYGQDTVMMASEAVAQNPETDFGKVLAIDLASGKVTRVSSGHRNPQGILKTRGGTLLETEHGPKGGDELNVIDAGRNYGWPYETYGTDYTSYDWPPAKAAPTAKPAAVYTAPLFAFVPSIGVSNLIEIGTFEKAWTGDLIVASLKARSLFRLRLSADRNVVYNEPIFVGERVRDLVETEDGRIVTWTDSGQLLVLTVDRAKLDGNTRLAAVIDSAELKPCWTCHHSGPSQPGNQAPTLSGVFGRHIAADSFEDYSAALKGKNDIWSEDNLIAFLTNPQAFAPGTAMTYRATSDVDAARIVKRLKTLD